MMRSQIERMVWRVKLMLKRKKGYEKIDKTESMRVEMNSRRAQKLIAKKLKLADSIHGRCCSQKNYSTL
ncbi:hypothetical protein Cni_G21082 [Canna indica]|uniref:Uncharacterized protein n=1 Tax=Canna indica TaxID=4628 RepID=A0AAQ3QKD7_9LILI|nr:hypothetical protein Cni_G21082 [Canna indica]